LGTWTAAYAGLERVLEITDAPRSVEDFPNAKDTKIEKGKLELENVTFGYVKDRPVLNNITFTVQPGEKIAILGATGSGKSSLIYLIPRFYDIRNGQHKNRLHRHTRLQACFPQEADRRGFAGCFPVFGHNQGEYCFWQTRRFDGRNSSSCQVGQLHEFIESLPCGYETTVGERGLTLSGGQKQRVTIARALVGQPEDSNNGRFTVFCGCEYGREIQSAIEEATKRRTTLIIAQRFSTIKDS